MKARKIFIILSVLVSALIFVCTYFLHSTILAFLLVGPFIYMGIHDIVQQKQSIKRNFPLVGRLRYVLEKIRPEIYQYFIESDTDGTPISRNDRAVVYQRAKQQIDTTPFGTQLNVYADGYEWMIHSTESNYFLSLTHSPRVTFGRLL